MSAKILTHPTAYRCHTEEIRRPISPPKRYERHEIIVYGCAAFVIGVLLGLVIGR